MKKCELCDSLAKMYCESDQASLCWDCDSQVHGANFLVSKHSRTLLCHVCQSSTPWSGSGPKLSPTISVCESCVNSGDTQNEANDHGDDYDDDDDDDDDDGSGGEDDLDREDNIEDDDDGHGHGDENQGDIDEDDEENQVVPWSSTPPPSASSSSTSEEGLSDSRKKVFMEACAWEYRASFSEELFKSTIIQDPKNRKRTVSSRFGNAEAKTKGSSDNERWFPRDFMISFWHI